MEKADKPRRIGQFWPIYNPATGKNRFEWILEQAERLRNERRRALTDSQRRFKEI